MATKVTVNSSPVNRISIDSQKQEVVRVTTGGAGGDMDYDYVITATQTANTWANSVGVAAGTGANNYLLTVISGANTAIGAGSNSYTNSQITVVTGNISNTTNIAVSAFEAANSSVGMDYAYVNTATQASNTYADTVGVGANNYLLTVIDGANTSIGAGANAYAATVGTSANNYLLTVIDGSNTSVGAGANVYAATVGVGANTYLLTVISGANTTVGAGANNYLLTVIGGANTAVGAGANAYAATKVSSVSGTAGEIYSSGGTTPTLNLIATGVTADTYGGATQIPVVTVDALGRITSAANVGVQGMDYAYVNTATQASNTYAATVGVGANAYMIAVQNGSNTAIGAGANAYAATVGTSANNYLLTVIDGANTSVGAGANAYMIAVQNGSNTAIGAGANAYAATVGVGANNYLLTVISGANTAIGAGANAYADTVGAGANSYLLTVISGANTAVGAGANAYADTKVSSVSGTAGEIYSSGGTTPTLNLIATGVTADTYGGATQIPVVTIDALGRIISAANVALTASADTTIPYVWTNTHTFTANVTLNSLVANGSLGVAGQVLTSNGNTVYWSTVSGGPGASVTTSATAPGSPSDGDLWWNTDLGRLLIYYDDGDTQQWVDAAPTGDTGPVGATGPAGPKSLTIVYPTASEDITILYTEAQHIVSRIATVMLSTGTSTVDFTLRYGPDRSATGTEIKTGGMTCSSNTVANEVTVFDSATIPTDNFIWLETSSITGSVQEFHVSLTF